MLLVALCISTIIACTSSLHLVPFTTDPESFEDDKWNRAAFETYCTRHTTTHMYNDIHRNYLSVVIAKIAMQLD